MGLLKRYARRDQLGAFLVGAEDGSTLGQGDEIESMLFGPDRLEDARVRMLAAQKRDPLGYGLGELGGAAGSGMLIGGGVAALSRSRAARALLAALSRRLL